MRHDRRIFLKRTSLGLGLATTAIANISLVETLLAGNKRLPFQNRNVSQVMAQLGARHPVTTDKITLKAPYLAEIGKRVPIKVTSHIPNTESITIIVDRNNHPLAAQVEFAKNQIPYMNTEIKMARDSNVRVLVKANGRYYMTSKVIEVTEGGCGG